MENVTTVAIQKKDSPADGRELRKLLASADSKEIACRGSSTLFRFEGQFGLAEIRKISKELLCDPVTEKYSLNAQPADNKTFFVDVWYKPGVTDAVGESILKAVADLGIATKGKAFSGRRYEFRILSARSGKNGVTEKKVLGFLAKRLLNPLIQECRILTSAQK